MGKGRVEIDIARPADEVFKVVSDFGGIDQWMPGIESCRVEGDTRIIGMMGMEITERLLRNDQEARVVSYGIVGGVPVERHEATITVTSTADDSSHVDYDVEVVPDDLLPVMTDLYQKALQVLAEHLGA